MTMIRDLAMRGISLLAAACLLATAVRASSTVNVVYSFAGEDDGEYTDTELAVDQAGNLYGSSVQGGLFGGGTVFQVSPSGIHTVLYNFTGGADGGEPYKGVTLDAAGNLYGTAVTGGSGSCEGGCGVVFKLTRSASGYDFSVIHAFTGGRDGSGPGSPVTVDRYGNVYGMTPTGGALGVGTIYVLRPGTNGYTLQVLHTFTGGADGLGGSGGRLLIPKGQILYGVSTAGGANGLGNIFQLTPAPSGEWPLKVLYAFKGGTDGSFPYGGVTQVGSSLYGTTYYQGSYGFGTVYQFQLTTGKERVLHSFTGGQDGGNPISTLVADRAGNLYGTTSEGGAASCGCGTVFQLTPAGGWKPHVLYSFPGSPGPGFAYNGLVVDAAGNLYGATVHGGPSNDGTIYQLNP